MTVTLKIYLPNGDVIVGVSDKGDTDAIKNTADKFRIATSLTIEDANGNYHVLPEGIYSNCHIVFEVKP